MPDFPCSAIHAPFSSFPALSSVNMRGAEKLCPPEKRNSCPPKVPVTTLLIGAFVGVDLLFFGLVSCSTLVRSCDSSVMDSSPETAAPYPGLESRLVLNGPKNSPAVYLVGGG